MHIDNCLFDSIKPICNVADIVLILDAASAEYYKDIIISKLDNYLNEVFSIYNETKYRKLHSLRASIVWFNDTDKSDHYYKEMPFTSLPDEKGEIISYFSNLSDAKISGCRTAMETLYGAANADWIQDGDRMRHLLVLLTDHEDSIGSNSYEDVNLPHFYDAWEEKIYLGQDERTVFKKLSSRGQRMIIVAPSVYPYNEMEVDLEYLVRIDIQQGRNCEDIRSKELINMIVQAIRC